MIGNAVHTTAVGQSRKVVCPDADRAAVARHPSAARTPADPRYWLWRVIC